MTGPLDQFLAAYGQPQSESAPIESPSFSVIVRTQGRRPRSLIEALDALAAQDHEPSEVILVVHGPQDRVEEVASAVHDRLPGQLRVIGTDGGGRSTPLNAGLDALSDTDYFCFLDDDDLVMADWLSAFARGAGDEPDVIVRAVTQSQKWSVDANLQPDQPTGEVELPFPDRFDLLAHMSLNLTPICSVAYPRRVVDEFSLRFCEDLEVYEDWDFLLRAAMVVGVVSIPDQTSLYRRLEHGNADSAASVESWQRAHAMVIDRLAAQPVLLPPGDARRLAATHFEIDGRSRYESDLARAEARIHELTRSPWRWLAAFAARVARSIRRRT